jgi:hypothetical protein
MMNMLIFDIFTKIFLVNLTSGEKRVENVGNLWIILFYFCDGNKNTFIVDSLFFSLLISSNMKEKEKKRFFTEDSFIDKKNNCFHI